MTRTQEKLAALKVQKLARMYALLSVRMAEMAGYIQGEGLNSSDHAVCVEALNDMLALSSSDILAATSDDRRWWLAQSAIRAARQDRPLADLARKEREIANYQRFFPGCRVEPRKPA